MTHQWTEKHLWHTSQHNALKVSGKRKDFGRVTVAHHYLHTVCTASHINWLTPMLDLKKKKKRKEKHFKEFDFLWRTSKGERRKCLTPSSFITTKFGRSRLCKPGANLLCSVTVFSSTKNDLVYEQPIGKQKRRMFEQTGPGSIWEVMHVIWTCDPPCAPQSTQHRLLEFW